MTPKSLLRHKRATSVLDELANGRFETVIADDTVDDPSGREKIKFE